jgi:succinate dehydrogenase / fumarate reductase membrane anchor subunit
MQRLTAIANVPLVLFFLVLMAMLAGQDHAAVTATLGNPVIAILLLAAMLSVIVHMRLGMQVIIEDYVHAEGAKIALLIFNTFFCVVIGLAAAFALLRISFGL